MNETAPRLLPAIQDVLAAPLIASRMEMAGRVAMIAAVRAVIDQLRTEILAGALIATRPELLNQAIHGTLAVLDQAGLNRLGPVINATGVILHTGLGRAPLAPQAVAALARAGGYCNLEVDLESGARRHRGYQVQAAWKQLTGSEDSLIVNNNAAATLLTLQALCRGKEVLISRGQLIEIGGSFRLPDIFSLSGSILKEVGTTNRTHLEDYATAIGPQTAAILHVHPSNYRIVGFSQTPAIAELVELGKQHGILVIDDIGSGSLIDLTRYGLPAEPTFGESLQAGADIVLGSGDKLLGGPQCGIILGRHEPVNLIRKHPLARAVRIDKLTLGALSATLDLYCQGLAEQSIPVFQMLTASLVTLMERARRLVESTTPTTSLTLEIREDVAEVGGGALPAVQLPTAVIGLRHSRLSAEEFSGMLRRGVGGSSQAPRVFTRIQRDQVLLDLRSVLPDQDASLATALKIAASKAWGI
ncbi:MAG: L-seryl-tRNA(Sec) selenium transferase [Planctomycetaceae bacterium]|nr:L-seryl-tRNA(Sec) selenium transferase [Planctomycetaceae bacterium]